MKTINLTSKKITSSFQALGDIEEPNPSVKALVGQCVKFKSSQTRRQMESTACMLGLIAEDAEADVAIISGPSYLLPYICQSMQLTGIIPVVVKFNEYGEPDPVVLNQAKISERSNALQGRTEIALRA